MCSYISYALICELHKKNDVVLWGIIRQLTNHLFFNARQAWRNMETTCICYSLDICFILHP